jgi:nucleoside 2-deoxyribosyltransferase
MTLGHTTPQTCFIIAPITTPEERITLYQNDANHCRHVIEHLLVPAVEKAGFKPLLPIAEGSHLIHAEVIRHLREADLVLCDMSGLNANVFFEVGIRTAQNKPVCLTHTTVDLTSGNYRMKLMP